jgi:four helix bundle protein
MPFKFENLKVWQKAVELSDEIDFLTKSFPKIETYSLVSQMKRAADSVCLNIAEGSIGQSNAEMNRFLGISLRSAVEVVCCLIMAHRRKYIMKEVFDKLYIEYEILCKMITSFRSKI